jgi:hypothetical protein
MKRIAKGVLAALALLALWPALTVAKVGSITMEALISGADVIVIGKVTRVLNVAGTRVAEVQVSRSLKGEPGARLAYLAQPTWMCDITGGDVDDEGLFFLYRYPFEELAREGSDSLDDFEQPKDYQDRIEQATGGAPFFVVAHAGRGFMPTSIVEEEPYVTIWTGDVRLVESIATVSGPDGKSRFIRSARLEDVIGYILGVLGT